MNGAQLSSADFFPHSSLGEAPTCWCVLMTSAATIFRNSLPIRRSWRTLKIGEQGVDPFVSVNEALAKIGIFGQQLVGFHLVRGLALFGGVGHECARFLQHADELLHVGSVRQRAVSWNDLHVV